MLTPSGVSIFLMERRDLNDRIATCRWHVAATSANTGGYHNFRPFPGENANKSLTLRHVKNRFFLPDESGFLQRYPFLSEWVIN